MDHCLIAYCLLQYMIKFKKERIMSLKLIFTVKATLVKTCEIAPYSYGYKRSSHCCSIVIRYIQL